MKSTEEIKAAMLRHLQNSTEEEGLQKQLSIVAAATLEWVLSKEEYVIAEFPTN